MNDLAPQSSLSSFRCTLVVSTGNQRHVSISAVSFNLFGHAISDTIVGVDIHVQLSATTSSYLVGPRVESGIIMSMR